MHERIDRIFKLLKRAKGVYVPASHIAAVLGIADKEANGYCNKMCRMGYTISGRCMKNGDKYEMHWWWYNGDKTKW